MSKRWVQLKRVWRAFWQAYWREINPVHRARLLGTITASLTIGGISLVGYMAMQWFFTHQWPSLEEMKAAAATGITSSGLAYQIFPKYLQLKLASTTPPEPTMVEPIPDDPEEIEEESNG